MRLFSLVSAMIAAMALPLAAQDVSPEAYWAGIYQSYWDEASSYSDCAARPDFCTESTRRRCEEIWFIRNQLFNANGQCFKSPLGQVMFDNADCTTNDASLGSFHAEYIAHIRTEETVIGCAVDTSAAVPLDIENLADRMNAYPFLGGDGGPSGCQGWKGASFTLHAEPRADAPIVAEVQPGADLVAYLESFSQPGTWWYYGSFGKDGTAAEGWGAVEVFPPEASDQCESYAG